MLQSLLEISYPATVTLLPATDCRVTTTASEAGSYGTQGCTTEYPLPYCCTGSSRSNPYFPTGVYCTPDTSGVSRGGSCTSDEYVSPACCHVDSGDEDSSEAPDPAPAPSPSGDVMAASCARILQTADAAGSFGLAGCAPYSPYCCDGSSHELDSYPNRVPCALDTSGSERGGGCVSGYAACC